MVIENVLGGFALAGGVAAMADATTLQGIKKFAVRSIGGAFVVGGALTIAHAPAENYRPATQTNISTANLAR